MESLNFEQFKADIHRTLISKLDLEKLSTVQPARARQAVASLVNEIVIENKMPLSAAEKERLQSDLLDEVFGLGPIEALLRDPQWHSRRIADIAAEAGFTDLSYFNRAFRRHYGATPSDIRARSNGDAGAK